ncbi:hypothetical protein [Blautia sp. XA-2221]|uniref:hypothetical protein n=1 Tax=Blautia sp. XA-2221 TaxID=2903961 RepID=UPI0023789139|nr:hypothetical protein [Blautia sp. XA-2221]
MKLPICVIMYFCYRLNIMTTDGGFARKVFCGVSGFAIARAVVGIETAYLHEVFMIL